MTMQPNEDQQAFLARLLDGSRSLEDPETVEFFRLYPSLREHYDELALVVQGVKVLAAESEAAGRESSRSTTEQDRQQVGRHWPSIVEGASADGGAVAVPAPRAGGRAWRWAAAAAAAVIALLGIRVLLLDPSTLRGGTGMGGRLALNFEMVPSGLADGFDVFRISPAPTQGTKVVFVVYDANGDVELVRAEVPGSEWVPSDDERAKMEAQGALLWEFQYTDPIQSRLETGEASAYLAGFGDAADGEGSR